MATSKTVHHILVDLIDHIAGICNKIVIDARALVGKRKVTGAAPILSSRSALHTVPKTGGSLSCHPSF